MFFWINVLIGMYQLEETRFGPWEMTWVRDISEGSHNENGRMWKNAKRRAVCLRGVVSVVGSVVVCILTFLVFVDFHMFFAFCTYAKKTVSDATSANVVYRCYMY